MENPQFPGSSGSWHIPVPFLRKYNTDPRLGGEALDFLSKTTLWNDSTSNGPRMELSIILMDLEMPIMDGLACTRRIRDLEREGRINGPVPIIAVTANTRMEQMEQALEAGMVSPEKVVRLVKR